jgi:hypothetical protein
LTSRLISHHFPGRNNLPLLAPPGPSEITANSDTAPDGGIELGGLMDAHFDTERTPE